MNVLNVEAVEREFVRCASYARHPAVKEWVATVARNYFLSSLQSKDIEANLVVYDPAVKRNSFHVEMPNAKHLPDWAVQALERKETLYWFDPVQVRRRNFWQAIEQVVHWFNNWPDNDRRWGRLTRINFDTAASAAAMFMVDVQSNLWDYVKDCPPVIRDMPDRFRWVKLHTALHFERESRLMNHCVGNGHYYGLYQQGQFTYYSLRDRFNKPHVTIEVNAQGQVCQCKGRGNAKPIAEYQRHIYPFIVAQGWAIRGDNSYIDVPCSAEAGFKEYPAVIVSAGYREHHTGCSVYVIDVDARESIGAHYTVGGIPEANAQLVEKDALKVFGVSFLSELAGRQCSLCLWHGRAVAVRNALTRDLHFPEKLVCEQ